MTIHYDANGVTLYHGDALTIMKSLPDASVNCCVTSPPYFGLRDYGVDGQLGLEASPAEYVENQRALFNQVRRVLADYGTLWLNLGDSFVAGGSMTGTASMRQRLNNSHLRGVVVTRGRSSLPVKNLMGIPWRVAFALQDDGWILRNAIVWHKPNGMPTSVTDRLATKYEMVFMFSKSTRYWFNLDAVRQPAKSSPEEYARAGKSVRANHRLGEINGSKIGAKSFAADMNPLGVNPGDVWTIATQPFSEAHFATFPLAIPSRAIQAGCKPGGTVLDPFSGSGTTGLASANHDRKYIGIDINIEYLDLSLRTRLAQQNLFATETTTDAT